MSQDGEFSQHDWAVIATRVRGRAMAQVSCRDNPRGGAPLYSMRVGTTQVLNDGSTRISGHMSLYDVADAIVLLQELSESYLTLREEQRRDYEESPGLDPGERTPTIARSYRATRNR